MTIINMLQQSGILTLLGMGIVFSFLIIMVIVISQFGEIINKKNSGKNDGVPIGTNLPPPTDTVNKPEITAVISAAVTEYRKAAV